MRETAREFDFETMLERRGHDAMAVDAIGDLRTPIAPRAPKGGFDAIPMWVADMNFPTCPSIVDSLVERAKHPAFGYYFVSDDWYRSIIDWHEKRNGVANLKREHIGYENGVLGGVVSALGALCSPGDNVLLQSPTYIGFTHALEDNGYHIVLNPLRRDEEGAWRLDYEDMEHKIVKNHVHAAVFCAPHNPTGRVWEREELERVCEIFERHDVWVISDEIWSDIILPGHEHLPLQSVNSWARAHTVALYAPSKTFNLAGLVGSYHIIYDKWLRDRVKKVSINTHYNDMNVLSMHALVGAYGQAGQHWVDELREVIGDNVDYAYGFVKEHFAGIDLAKPEGTYMLFLDCSTWCQTRDMTTEELLHAGWDVGVAWQDGRPFHGEHSIRMNLALPHAKVKEAFDRLERYVFS